MILTTQVLTLQQGPHVLYQAMQLTFQPGECWGILGANGSGKTTLLHTLAGLQSPAHGAVYLGMAPVRTLNRKKRAQQIGLLLQETMLPPLQTVVEYCRMARFPHTTYWQPNQAGEAIVQTALSEMALTSYATRRLSSLSGGEKQRVAIASILVQAPHIYVLDEPTNHLDIRYQIKVLRHLRELATNSNKTVIMSLHDVHLASAFCTHLLLLLPQGRVLHGPREAILTQDHLTALYQHPMVELKHRSQSLWHPIY